MKCDKQGGRNLLGLSTEEEEGSIFGHGETKLREGSGTRGDAPQTGVDATRQFCAWVREC